jgi:putative endonuclease
LDVQLLYRAFDVLRDRARMRVWDKDLARGRHGEDVAHRYLQARGYKIVARNFRTRNLSAEVDLVAWDGPQIVFVEVKSRETEEFGAPDRAVDLDKQRKILRAAAEYLHRVDLGWDVARFDVVNVVFGSEPMVRHVEDAFSRARTY